MPNLDKLKARLSQNDSVQFEFRERQLTGTIATFGAKRAVVIVKDEGQYRVPYQSIQPLGETKDYTAKEQGALETCRHLLGRHNLPDWSAHLDDSMRRAGVCKYRGKQISLSRFFLRKASEAEILDTILHEIAHALAGFEHHHDAVWRNIALQIGCSGNRCHDIKFGLPRWIMFCPGRCFVTTRKRRARRRICAQCGRPVEFVDWTKERELALGDIAKANLIA